jgi:hypothetical protein
MKLTDHLTASDDVVAREVGGETILLDLASGNYFGLDAVGARLWQVIEERGCSIGEACDVLLAEYEVEREVLEKDVLALAAQLAEQKLVTAG